MSRSPYPVLIVGQGLAGSLIAFELIKNGKDFIIMDDFNHPSASKVAGGIYHPLIGQKLVKTWLADEAIPYALAIYKELEKKFSIGLLHEMPFYETLENPGELNDWDGRSDSFRNQFIEDKLNVKLPSILKEKKHRILQQNYSGYLDTQKFLNVCLDFFKESNKYSKQTFNESLLEFKEDLLHYNAIPYSAVVLCTGYAIDNSEFFNFLPMKATKGETAIVSCPGLDLDGILHDGIFIQPLGNSLFRLGSTYHWTWDNIDPDQRAVIDFLKKFHQITGFNAELISATAGIRPSAHDRRPYMGEHPHIKNLFVFSGLGSKGVLLGPLMAKQMNDLILESVPVHPEADINRLKKYQNTN